MVFKDLTGSAKEESEICKFFSGKTLFITGASGFLGTVLLEALLRCCPDICKIYILLRPKKGVLPDDRKNLLFEKKIFDKVKACNPDILKKVAAISGDISQGNLGIDDKDMNKLTEEVSIVFHAAATISFTRPLSFTICHNVIATNSVIDFCRRLRKLEVLVYTSTAYSNSNKKVAIEESIYDLPFSTEEIIKFGRYSDEEQLMKLYHMCNPPFPNFYTFSKCVSENLLKEKAHDLPVTIIRPPIIFSVLKEPLPGYVEPGSAMIDLFLAVEQGFVRVLQVDKNKKLEIIPADVVANTHIVAAFHQFSRRLSSPSVYNCVTGELTYITWEDFVQSCLEEVRSRTQSKRYAYPILFLCKNSTLYFILALILHRIPAVIFDLLFWLTGNKIRMVKMYRFYESVMNSVQYFTMSEQEIRNEKFQALSKTLNAVDGKIFHMDLKDFTLNEIKKIIPTGNTVYRQQMKPFKVDLKFTHMCLKCFLISLLAWLIFKNV